MSKTSIEWTATAKADGSIIPGYTFNIVWGCVEQSPACGQCYARIWSRRLGKDLWGSDKPRQVMSDAYWRQPLKWNRKAEKEGLRLKVFCSSMADVFEDHPTVDQERAKLWPLIRATPQLDWLLLTKRADKIAACLPEDWADGYSNVWLGVTVENQEWANKRIPYLLEVPAAVRFLSCEPLLGSIRFGDVPGFNRVGLDLSNWWIICGGESGHKARPMQITWALDIWRQTRTAFVPFFMKQMSQASWPDYKNFDSFPPDLQVREFPR